MRSLVILSLVTFISPIAFAADLSGTGTLMESGDPAVQDQSDDMKFEAACREEMNLPVGKILNSTQEYLLRKCINRMRNNSENEMRAAREATQREEMINELLERARNRRLLSEMQHEEFVKRDRKTRSSFIKRIEQKTFKAIRASKRVIRKELERQSATGSVLPSRPTIRGARDACKSLPMDQTLSCIQFFLKNGTVPTVVEPLAGSGS